MSDRHLKARYTNSRALVIGIDKYQHARPLSFAVNDASEIRRILVEELAFPVANVDYLTDADATRESILKAYLRFTAADIDVDERLLVFFAGHGYTRKGMRGDVGYLVPYDANVSDLATLLRWDDLTRNADLIPAKHVLFIMDACYGGLALTRSSQPASARFLNDMMRRYSRQVLTAGKADELVADSGGPIPNHSVFTGHLIEGLRGKAAAGDGVLTASALMAYVYGKVANDKYSRQTPHYGYFDGDGDFIISANFYPTEKPDIQTRRTTAEVLAAVALPKPPDNALDVLAAAIHEGTCVPVIGLACEMKPYVGLRAALVRHLPNPELHDDDDASTMWARIAEYHGAKFATTLLAQHSAAMDNGKSDCYTRLAALPLPLYLTTTFDEVLADHLRQAGRYPMSMVCSCGSASRSPGRARLEQSNVGEPSIERPIVYHLFGHKDYPETLVLSSDDHRAFQQRFAKLPSCLAPDIARSLVSSELLFVGYHAKDGQLDQLFSHFQDLLHHNFARACFIQYSPAIEVEYLRAKVSDEQIESVLGARVKQMAVRYRLRKTHLLWQESQSVLNDMANLVARR